MSLPYLRFSSLEWATLRFNTPMTLTKDEIIGLQGINENVSPQEVENIYLPLTRLFQLQMIATRKLYEASNTFFGKKNGSAPFIIGMAGSVSVGKSTAARLIQALLRKWPSRPKVEIIPTDGFLYPKAVLEERGILKRKGFPESYDQKRLIDCLRQLKSGAARVDVPIYSHVYYDIVPGEYQRIEQPDIVIVEGLNVLQTPAPDHHLLPSAYVSDFFDISLYLDADEQDLYHWYVKRFKKLQQTSFQQPGAYFCRYADLSESESEEIAAGLWQTINQVNLEQNIAPTKYRADVILKKRADHSVDEILVRKI